MNEKIVNIKEGFTSAGEFRGVPVVRMVIGHFHTTNDHVEKYFNAIIKTAQYLQDDANDS